MYQSLASQLDYLLLTKKSEDIISDSINEMVRTRSLMAGITPIYDDAIDPIHYRSLAMTYLKLIASKPVEVYTKLFDLHMVDDFVMHAQEFIKYLKGRKLLPTDIVMSEWDRYYTLIIKNGNLPLKDVNIETVKQYDTMKKRLREINKLEDVEPVEQVDRQAIKKYQGEVYSRLTKKLKNIHIAMLQTRNKTELKYLEEQEAALRKEIKDNEDEMYYNQEADLIEKRLSSNDTLQLGDILDESLTFKKDLQRKIKRNS